MAADTPPLTNIGAIKRLDTEEADQKLPVHFRGVVTGRNPVAGDLFVQDDTAAVYLVPNQMQASIRPGERVEVTGDTQRGDTANVVSAKQVTPLGQSSMPAARHVTVRDLAGGQLDGLRVEIEGLVGVTTRDYRYTNGPIVLGLTLSDGEVLATVWERGQDEWLLGLRGSRIRVSGVFTPFTNPQHQIVAYGLLVSGGDTLEVVEEPRATTAVRTTIADALRPDPKRPGAQLLRVEGVVTAVLSHLSFFVQDESGCILVRSLVPMELQPGNRVSLLGITRRESIASRSREQEATTFFFETHEVRNFAYGELPRARPVNEQGLLYAPNNHRRVAFEGVVLHASRPVLPTQVQLSVQVGGLVMDVLGIDVATNASLPIARSRVRVEGVLDHRPLPDSDYAGLRAHLAHLEDVTVLAGPPTDYARVVLVAFAASSALALLAFGWALTLRRGVRQRTAELARANAAKSEFLASMSHEIRTPMNAMLGLVQVLDRQLESREQRDILQHLAMSGRLLLRILNDILDFSKIEAGQVTLEQRPFSLEPVLAHLEELFGEAARTQILAWQVEGPATSPGWLRGDPLRLQQILANLAANAIKFTRRGSVHLQVGVISETASAVRLRFEVIDTGPGLTPEVLSRLFRPFTQADASITRTHGGSGLGLSICKRLVELMGGSIGATSTVGQGSTFWVELPFERSTPACEEHAADTGTAEEIGSRLAGCKILVVDDNRSNLRLAYWVVKQEGGSTVLVTDARQALALLRKEPDRFDAVLMDVEMPEFDGLDATRAIRQKLNLAELPVIAYTAGALRQDKDQAIAAGANDFVHKPVDVEQLVRVLRQWTRRGKQSGNCTTTAPARTRSSPKEEFPAIPGLDTGHAAARLGHNRDLFFNLLREFREEFADLCRELGENLERGRLRDANRRLHSLQGIAGTIGALELRATAVELQEVLELDIPQRTQLLEQLTRQMNTLMECLEKWRPSGVSPEWPLV